MIPNVVANIFKVRWICDLLVNDHCQCHSVKLTLQALPSSGTLRSCRIRFIIWTTGPNALQFRVNWGIPWIDSPAPNKETRTSIKACPQFDVWSIGSPQPALAYRQWIMYAVECILCYADDDVNGIFESSQNLVALWANGSQLSPIQN